MRVPEEEKEQEIKDILKNNDRKLSSPGKSNRHTSPRSTESPQQDEPKESHTKTHHN